MLLFSAALLFSQTIARRAKLVLPLLATRVLPLALSACGESGSTLFFPLPGEGSSEVDAVSFVTFNTALGVGLADYTEQRLTAIEVALPELQADVLCLQELWEYADVKQLSEAMKATHPYSHFSVAPQLAESAAGEGQVACSMVDADRLIECLLDNCSETPEALQATCAISSCLAVFTSVEKSCQECVIANPNSDPTVIAEICSSAGGNVESYSEQNGLLLLSKRPLQDIEFRAMTSSLGDRGILAATLEVSDELSVEVLCSHLTPAFSGIAYTGEFDNWAGEQDHHVEQLLEMASERARGKPIVVMGDLNCGPATSETPAVRGEAFQAFVQAGYWSPYTEASSPSCTFCSDNLLGGNQAGQAQDSGAIIDHILFSGWADQWQASTERVMDFSVEVEVEGVPTTTSYSDHYGVRIDLGQ